MISHSVIPIHVIMNCVLCPTVFDTYDSAIADAQRHANQTGHTIKGEVAYAIEITPKVKNG
jgi:hypothetical protein